MKDGIYEQLLNNELKSKLNESEFFYKTNTILKSPENAHRADTPSACGKHILLCKILHKNDGPLPAGHNVPGYRSVL